MKTPPLRMVFWETTAACNLRCQHCRRLTDGNHGDLDHEQACAVIDQIAACGRPVIVFSGGEALHRGDIFSLMTRAKRRGLPFALASNGALITAAMAQRIARAGVSRVAVSIDGSDALTHDGLRGVDGSFHAARNALARLHAAGVATQVNATITNLNKHQLDALHHLTTEAKADALHLFIMVPVGCGAEMDDAVRLSAGDQERVLRWLAKRDAAGGIKLKATCAPQYKRILAQRGQQARGGGHLDRTSRGCLAGSGVCFISHQGDVFPCGYLPQSVGNLTQSPLHDLWAQAPLFHKLRNPNSVHGRCGACEHREDCGGCRARALAVHHDAFAEEPGCPYVPKMHKATAN